MTPRAQALLAKLKQPGGAEAVRRELDAENARLARGRPVIFERVFDLRRGRKRSPLRLRCYQPLRRRALTYVCVFSLGEGRAVQRYHARGVDSLQAIVLALRYIAVLLEAMLHDPGVTIPAWQLDGLRADPARPH